MADLDKLDKIPKGKYKGRVVEDLVNESTHNIMELLREGYTFTSDVLASAHIRKTIRDVRAYNEVISRPKKKDEELLKKDTKRQAEKVIEELNTQEEIMEE